MSSKFISRQVLELRNYQLFVYDQNENIWVETIVSFFTYG